jgi:hypothetical protein
MRLPKHLNHVAHGTDHTAHFGGVFQFGNAVHLIQAKTLQSGALRRWTTDRRTDLLDFDFSHNRLLRNSFGVDFSSFAATATQKVGDFLAATLRY